jgi:hypothetical protein
MNQRLGNRFGEASALLTTALVEWLEGARQAAVQLAEKSAAVAAESGIPWRHQMALQYLAEWSQAEGQTLDAERFGRGALEINRRLGDRQAIVYSLAFLARLAAERGDASQAGVLWGALEAEEQRGVIGQWEAERAEYAAYIQAARGLEFEAGRHVGRQLSLAAAAERALSHAHGVGPRVAFQDRRGG